MFRPRSSEKFGGRIRVWLRRYLAAELVCTPAAVLCGWSVGTLGSMAAAAVAASCVENLAFYGMMLRRELAGGAGMPALPGILYKLVLEFGPAETLDTLVLRPALVYAGMILAPTPALGVIAGKIAADVCFYVPTIASYELMRRPRRPRWRSICHDHPTQPRIHHP